MIYLVSNQLKILTDSEIIPASVEETLAYFKDHEIIALDTETEGYDPHTCKILSLQLGDTHNQFVIDTSTVNILFFKDLLENTTIIMHNAQFDLKFLLKNGIDVKSIYDTFLAECVLTTGYESKDIGLGLSAVTLKYCQEILSKDIRGQIHWRGLDTAVIKYGAKDVEFLHQIRELQLKEIAKYNLEAVLDLENRVVRVFAKMGLDGIKLDASKWTAVSEITERKSKELIEKLDNMIYTDSRLKGFIPQGVQQNLFGYEERVLAVNWSSPAQKLKILNTLGLNLDSVGDRILQKNKRSHELVPLLIEYAKMSKLSSAFGREFLKFINPVTGRVHSSFWQILKTGRISVSNPNLNQIPSKGDLAKSIRAAFIPEEGSKIVGGDYSSFELAIIAEYSKDPLWVNTLNNNGNLHSELCAATFNIPLDSVNDPFPPKPDLKYRDVQKTVDFGLAYGMSYFKLADTIQVSDEEAQKIIDKFFSVVPAVEKFLTKLGNYGKKYGYIVTPPPFKRIRWFPKWQGKNTDRKDLGAIERASKNTPIQGANGNVIKLALCEVQDRIDKDDLPIKILLSIYDEIQTECKDDLTDWWQEELQTTMIGAAKKCLKTVPIEVDVKITNCWTK